MYHWYRLIRSFHLHVDHLMQEFGKDDCMYHVSTSIRKKWFWLGLIEVLPIIAGLIISGFYSVFFHYDFLAIGIVLSLIIAWMLKGKSPEPPIHLEQMHRSFPEL